MSAPDEPRFSPHPRDMDRAAFVRKFGGVYEHSPWIAERLWEAGLDPRHDTPGGLHAGLAAILVEADTDAKWTLVRVHPDLAGKAAVHGELTEDSTAEQSGAGLDQCTPEQYARFQELNHAYKAKFGFPFILAVSGRTRHEILAAFEKRICNDRAREFEEALGQIGRIARLRLDLLVQDPASG